MQFHNNYDNNNANQPAALAYCAQHAHKHRIKLIIFHRPEFQYSCGRESQIWKVTKAAAIAYPTERTIQLAKHKTNPPGFQPFFMLNCGRSSPIWRPSTAAMSAKLRPRTAQLAMPKPFHQNYLPPRQVRGKKNLQCHNDRNTGVN